MIFTTEYWKSGKIRLEKGIIDDPKQGYFGSFFEDHYDKEGAIKHTYVFAEDGETLTMQAIYDRESEGAQKPIKQQIHYYEDGKRLLQQFILRCEMASQSMY